ncbi:hypothetical protein DM01DRAFT_1345000 [Hesseltinella vesiculosa]|uniref:Uncharacterized protein n=1 Tax=Hesseltinella vesiculosa TaxID=101127 RepID=A0A1X2GLD0_9FUNG|nr:hypothetical protein DM01DRAFT_1345000 [Hesseltinella vesiculosa]
MVSDSPPNKEDHIMDAEVSTKDHRSPTPQEAASDAPEPHASVSDTASPSTSDAPAAEPATESTTESTTEPATAPTAAPAPATTQPSDMTSIDCTVLSPTLHDVLSDPSMVRLYQDVKEIRMRRSPQATSVLFYAMCQAFGEDVTFLKVPNMNKIMFRQQSGIFAVNLNGQSAALDMEQMDALVLQQQQHQHQQESSSHGSGPSSSDQSTLAVAAAAAANLFAISDSQQLLQAALSSVGTHGNGAFSHMEDLKRKRAEDKKPKRPSPRAKDFAVRRHDIFHDIFKTGNEELMHHAHSVSEDVKLILLGRDSETRLAQLSPLHRFSELANLAAHYDSDFAPKNAGVYYNYEYFQLYAAFRDFEKERSAQQATKFQQDQQNPATTISSKPFGATRNMLVQCRSEIERTLVNTNWEAIRRRLTIGERIHQMCAVFGRGFLLLSRHVSGRKLLHNFNSQEWADFMRDLELPQSQPMIQQACDKLSVQRLLSATSPAQNNAVPSLPPMASASSSASTAAPVALNDLSQAPQQSRSATYSSSPAPSNEANDSSASDMNVDASPDATQGASHQGPSEPKPPSQKVTKGADKGDAPSAKKQRLENAS